MALCSRLRAILRNIKTVDAMRHCNYPLHCLFKDSSFDFMHRLLMIVPPFRVHATVLLVLLATLPLHAGGSLDGIYYGVVKSRSVNQNGRMLEAPGKIVVYPDGKSALLNVEIEAIHSVPMRGKFTGNVFSGIAKKKVGLITDQKPIKVTMSFSPSGDRLVLNSEGEPSLEFWREGTSQATAVQKRWKGLVAKIKSFDPSKVPYTYKALDASTEPLAKITKHDAPHLRLLPDCQHQCYQRPEFDHSLAAQSQSRTAISL